MGSVGALGFDKITAGMMHPCQNFCSTGKLGIGQISFDPGVRVLPFKKLKQGTVGCLPPPEKLWWHLSAVSFPWSAVRRVHWLQDHRCREAVSVRLTPVQILPKNLQFWDIHRVDIITYMFYRIAKCIYVGYESRTEISEGCIK